MVRTRKKDYTEEAMQQEHRQTAQSDRVEMAGSTDAATHIGKRSRNEVFDRFQQLPCELRLMVWEAAMTPRLVAVNPRPCPKDRDQARNRKTREINIIRRTPAFLAINQEARHFALRHYTWRFTIDVTINGEHRRARVVMSPDDTLGLFRCKKLRRRTASVSDFRVKVANDKSSPWRIHQTTDAPHDQHWFKKVASLGDAVQSNLHIVRALNVTLWDLDSILHAVSSEVRSARSPHTKHRILIQSAKMDMGLRALAEAFSNRRQLQYGQNVDILACTLSEDKKEQDWQSFLLMLSRRSLGLHRYMSVRSSW